VFPGFGSPDPLAQALEGWGLRADSGRPIVGVRSSPAGDEVISELRAQGQSGDQSGEQNAGQTPLARAIVGLSASVPWAVPLELTPTAGVRSEVILSARPARDVSAWGESQWVLVWRGVNDPRLRVAPTLDEAGRDRPLSDAGVALGLALERDPRGEQSRGQRLMVLGASGTLGAGWFSDGVASREMRVDGRTINPNPANGALFEGGLLWLAGLEDRIAQGAEIRRGAMVRGERELGAPWQAVRLALIAGLPVVTLALGWAALRRRERQRG
jgi:hypothetical protein